MRKPLRLAICLLVAPAVLVSGCGSTRTASTSTSAPANESAQTVPQSTSSKQAQRAKKAPEPNAAEAKPEQNVKAEVEVLRQKLRQRKAERRAAATPRLVAVEQGLPLIRRYPKDLQGSFLISCKTAKASTSICECIVAKQELNLKVERGQSLAELLALELAFLRKHASLEDIRRHRVPAPRIVRRVARECK